jgi:tetratricopeptide (TPR) repeat protein
MTARLISTERTALRTPLPESIVPPDGTWGRTTAQHLVHWAIYLSLVDAGNEPSAREIGALLTRAIQISPLNPTARLALAQFEQRANGGSISAQSLGLSRDAVSLSWCASRLLAAGNKDEARTMYARAILVATSDEPSREVAPRFSDDPRIGRYLLPGEEPVRDIVKEMLSRSEWTFSEWSTVLPTTPTVSLAVGRLLREQDRSEADEQLEQILNDQQPSEGAKPPDPLVLAARAEALALRSRWRDAEEKYRLAIDLIDDETIKRAWWFNLADIAQRLDDEGLRQTALRAALAVATNDDIARRVTEIQRTMNARPISRPRGTKAN